MSYGHCAEAAVADPATQIPDPTAYSSGTTSVYIRVQNNNIAEAYNTTEFAEAIVSNFGKSPVIGAKPVIPNEPETPAVCHLEVNAMMVSKEAEDEKIVGVDMFIESIEQPELIAQKCLHHGGIKFKLISISNRGTQV